MEKTITVTECDVCGRKEKESYFHLQDQGWTKYFYKKDWRDGGHAGSHEREMIACPKCDGTQKAMQKLLKAIKLILK